MDPFHERLARVALQVAGSFGFAHAGGYAVQAHGFLSRASSDVDLFLREGLQVRTELRSSSFARLDVRSAADSAEVELGLDWRRNKPIQLAVGPVLHADDAVANKVCALSDGQRYGITSTLMRFWPAAAAPKTNCLTWPLNTIPASTARGSPMRWLRSAACQTAFSRPMA